MNNPLRPWRVALLWDSHRLYCATAVRGIAEYERRYGPWQLMLGTTGEVDIHHLDFDGIIIYLDSRFEMLFDLPYPKDIPLVSIEQADSELTPWQVQPDHAAAGRMVAEEFIRRGFRRMIYWSNVPSDSRLRADQWDHDRNKAFSDAVLEQGGELLPTRRPAHDWTEMDQEWNDEQTINWLKRLPKPIGIMAANEARARQVIRSCELAEVRVPEEVSVIGVDNEIWSEVVLRGISTVELDGRRAGYEAARLLHQLMDKQPVPSGIIRIPPLRLITRKSSDTLAIDDPDVVTAVRFIADNATRSIRVSDVVEAVPLSRRALERRFHEKMRCSVLEHIRSVQIERVKLLLADKSISLQRVARLCGFRSAQSLGPIFRRLTGSTLTAYRKTLADP